MPPFLPSSWRKAQNHSGIATVIVAIRTCCITSSNPRLSEPQYSGTPKSGHPEIRTSLYIQDTLFCPNAIKTCIISPLNSGHPSNQDTFYNIGPKGVCILEVIQHAIAFLTCVSSHFTPSSSCVRSYPDVAGHPRLPLTPWGGVCTADSAVQAAEGGNTEQAMGPDGIWHALGQQGVRTY